MANDALTQNGAFAGAIAGMTQGWDVNSSATSPEYVAVKSAALAFAQEFDTLLNAAGTVGANAQRGFLAMAICAAIWQGRPFPQGATNPNTAATYAGIAAGAVGLYSAAVGSLA